jgi:hypothetical protein
MVRDIVPSTIFNSQPPKTVVDRYHIYKERLKNINGSGKSGYPSHDEKRELTYQVCEEIKWWDWRAARFGREEFPVVPILWKQQAEPKGAE